MEIVLDEFMYREKMRQFNEAYAKLRINKEAWEEELKERAEWEGTIGDGLEDELTA